MKYFIIISSLIQLTLIFYAFELNAQTFNWAKGINNSNGYGVSVDKDGNSYIIGDFHGTTSFDSIQLTCNGLQNIFLAKYSPAGNCLWAKKAGGVNDDEGYSVSVNPNGYCYVTGYINGTVLFDTIQLISNGGYDIFIAKYSPDGNCIWAKKAGGIYNDYGYSISIDPNRNSYITGQFKGTAVFGSYQLTSFGTTNQYDVFIAKYDSNGNCLWVKQAGGGKDDFGDRVVVDPNSNSYTAGFFTGPADFGSVHLTGYGIYYAIFVCKYDPNGNCIWAKQAGSPFGGGGTSINIDKNGNSYVTGYFAGTAIFDSIQLTNYGKTDIFLAKYNPNGGCSWAKHSGGTGTDQGWGISVDTNGNIFITGEFESAALFDTLQLNSSGGQNIFVAKYDSTGKCLWAIKAGGVSNDVTQAIETDKNGNSFITGTFNGPSAFGNFQLLGRGAFIAKISANPVAVKTEINPLPKDYNLFQNYPNPFNPSTIISYSLPSASSVKLIVYNILGQTVENLENEFKNAGNYSVNFNAAELPSGIYFYKIDAGQFSQVKKMILIK